MNRIVHFIISMLFTTTIFAQTFTSTMGGAIPDAPVGAPGPIVKFPLTVSGIGVINGTLGLDSITINVNHDWVEDLQIYLEAPDGMRCYLVSGNGGDGGINSGVNFTNTSFRQSSLLSIANITPAQNPYTRTYRPLTSIGYMNNGQNANGVWNLVCQDFGNQDAGTLVNFSLAFSTTPAPPINVCNNSPLAANRCADATPICLGIPYCGATGFPYSIDTFAGLTAAFQARAGATALIENEGFYKFVASATSATINFRVISSTNAAPKKRGVEVLVMNGGCAAPITTYAYTGYVPFTTPTATITTMNLTALTPGATYVLMVDGADADNTNYIFEIASGANLYSITPTLDTACSGVPVTLTASGGNGTYTWSPAIGLSATTGAVVTATQVVAAPISQTYTITYGAIPGLNCPNNTRTTTVRYVPNPTVTAPLNICQGNTAMLTPTTFGTWTTSAVSIASVTNAGLVTGIAPGTVTFTFIDTNTCAATTPLVTITPPLITPTFNAVAPFCSGTTAPILPTSSTNSITGTWSPATINNTTSATYTFTPTPGQCSNTATLMVSVLPSVTPTFTPITPFCSGTLAPVLPTTSNNGITGTWSPATVSNTMSATYTFTPTAGQCAVNTTLNVTVNPLLLPVIMCGTLTPTSVQFNWNAIAGATMGYSITYTINGGAPVGTTTMATTFSVNSLTLGDVVNITVMPLGSGCFASGTGSCTATACPGPTLTLTSPSGTAAQTICINSNITNITYNIGGSATGASASGLPPGITASFAAGTLTISGTGTTQGTFNYSAITTGGCSATPTLVGTIIVTPRTKPLFTQVPPICSSNPAPTLPTTSNNGIAGTWNPSTVSTTANGFYEFTPANGLCADTASMNIVVTPAATPTFNPVVPICIGATAPILPTTSNNGITGTWSPAVVNNVVTATYTFTPTTGQCANTRTLTVTVLNPVVPTFTPILPFCQGTAAPVLPPSSNNGIIGTWSPAVVSNINSGSYTFTPAPGQCAAPFNLPILVVPIPTVNLGNDTTICSPNTLVLNATSPLSTYLWQNGATTPTITVTQPGNYNVVVTNPLGCSGTDNVDVIFSQKVNYTLGRDTSLCTGASLVLNTNLTGAPGVTFLWNTGSIAPSITVATTGVYYVDVTNECGPQRDSVNVAPGVCRVFVPSAFSPNNDGRNDVFRALGTELVTKIDVQVFNRYGQLVYKSNLVNQSWNGKLQGKDAAIGTYVYIIKYTEGVGTAERTIKGTVTLLR